MKQKNGFTLVELLVVIGIISVLISMLLPALNKARESAKTIACLSNMRQVMMALTMYAQDNQSTLPWEVYFPPVGEGRYWPSRIAGSSGYLKNRDVLFCPSRIGLGKYGEYVQMVRNATTEDGWVWGYISYGANRYGAMPVSTDGRHRIKLGQTFVPPSSLMVLSESYYAPNANGALSLWGSAEAVSGVYDVWTHGSVTNAAFLDGHCESLQAADIGWDYKTRSWLPKASTSAFRSGPPWYFNQATVY